MFRELHFFQSCAGRNTIIDKSYSDAYDRLGQWDFKSKFVLRKSIMGEANKLHLIEEILKVEDPAVLAELETVIAKSKMHAVTGKSFKSFAGIMTEEEAGELEKIIEEGCEQINPMTGNKCLLDTSVIIVSHTH
jgi:hypothetical protein